MPDGHLTILDQPLAVQRQCCQFLLECTHLHLVNESALHQPIYHTQYIQHQFAGRLNFQAIEHQSQGARPSSESSHCAQAWVEQHAAGMQQHSSASSVRSGKYHFSSDLLCQLSISAPQVLALFIPLSLVLWNLHTSTCADALTSDWPPLHICMAS